MRRGVARLGRLMLAAALAYLIVGIIWQTAFYLAREPSVAELGSPWEGLLALLAWFVLPSALWPWSMSEFVPRGFVVAIGLFMGMTALMFAALTRLAPDVAPPREPRRPPKRRSPPRARVGTRRTS